MSSSKTEILQHVRFWIKSLWNAYHFVKNVCLQKILFWFILLRESDISWKIRAFLKSMFLNWKLYKVPDFEMTKVQRFRFWKKQRVMFWI